MDKHVDKHVDANNGQWPGPFDNSNTSSTRPRYSNIVDKEPTSPLALGTPPQHLVTLPQLLAFFETHATALPSPSAHVLPPTSSCLLE